MIAPEDVHVSVEGEVDGRAAEYARDKLVELIARVTEPVLFASVRLHRSPDPAVPRPALAEATVDLNGRPVRAHVAASEMTEAIDLMADRLERRVRRHEDIRRREGRQLHRTGEPAAHEWHHGDLPSHRPEYFPRPYEERELVRHKTFGLEPMTVDEAAFDLDRLGHDFYLFRELSSDVDTLIFYDDETERLGLLQPEGTKGDPTRGAAVPVDLRNPGPVLTTEQAIERLESGGEPFVFYTDLDTGRGCVLYRRYDGHWGLITPE